MAELHQNQCISRPCCSRSKCNKAFFLFGRILIFPQSGFLWLQFSHKAQQIFFKTCSLGHYIFSELSGTCSILDFWIVDQFLKKIQFEKDTNQIMSNLSLILPYFACIFKVLLNFVIYQCPRMPKGLIFKKQQMLATIVKRGQVGFLQRWKKR